jgi:hypothetical protein
MTDEKGNGLNGHEFLTVEDQRMIQKCYLDLIKIFEEVEKEMMKQGDAEQQRRREFLESFLTLLKELKWGLDMRHLFTQKSPTSFDRAKSEIIVVGRETQNPAS